MIKAVYKQDVNLLLDKGLSFGDEWTKEMFLTSFDTGRFFVFGYFLQDQLVGYVSYSLALDSADVEDVVVKQSFRRQGIGEKLLDFAIKEISQKSVEKIFLEVREGNEKAINLYSKKGFKQISVRKKYYKDGENAIIMAREL